MIIFPFGFRSILGERWLMESYVCHCYSCLDSSALWTLYFTMYYELCNPKVDDVLPNRRSESQGAICPYEWCSSYELRASRGGDEEGNRQNRLHLESRTPSWAGRGLWAICPVSMETTYQLEKQAPCFWKDGRAPGLLPRLCCLKEYPNYLCNRIES